MDKFTRLLNEALENHKDLSKEELIEKIKEIATPDNIVGCFSGKEIGEVYMIGRNHQDIIGNLKEGWTAEYIENVWVRADGLYKGIIWEEPEDTRLTEPMDTDSEEFKNFQKIVKMKKDKDKL